MNGKTSAWEVVIPTSSLSELKHLQVGFLWFLHFLAIIFCAKCAVSKVAVTLMGFGEDQQLAIRFYTKSLFLKLLRVLSFLQYGNACFRNSTPTQHNRLFVRIVFGGLATSFLIINPDTFNYLS